VSGFECLRHIGGICVAACMVAACAFPSTALAKAYVDEAGRRVDIPASPQRIVSLAPSITETLFALGLEREIVGVTMLSDYPEAARSKPRVGTYINISLERVVSLGPDLVIGTADGNRTGTVKQLERVGIPVYMVNPRSFEEICRMTLNLGVITGKMKQAEAVVADLKKRIDRVASLVKGLPEPRVFFQIGITPIVTVGKDTLHNELIRRTGGINIYEDASARYPRCGIEDIIARNPDIIIISSMKRGGDFLHISEGWKKWKTLTAVKDNRIHIINAEIVDHASPRIVDGLEKMARIIHPDVSWK